MSTDWNKETIPSLTLEPELDDAPELVVKKETALQQTQPETVLTPEEQKIVDDFAAKIDVRAEARKVMDALLESLSVQFELKEK